MLKQEIENLKQKNLTRKNAITILLYNSLQLGVRRSSYDAMIEFKTNQVDFYDSIKILSKLSLAKSYSGSVKGGFEKIKEISIKDLCSVLDVEYTNDVDVIKKCKRLLLNNKTLYKCEICDTQAPFITRDGCCVECSKLEPEVPKLRLAKCGHMSRYRYYNCEKCLETLPIDDEEIIYEVSK